MYMYIESIGNAWWGVCHRYRDIHVVAAENSAYLGQCSKRETNKCELESNCITLVHGIYVSCVHIPDLMT